VLSVTRSTQVSRDLGTRVMPLRDLLFLVYFRGIL